MALLALIFAAVAVAVACILWASRPHPTPSVTNWFYVGVAATVTAWAMQIVQQGGWHWTIR